MQVLCSSKYWAATKVSHQKFEGPNTASSAVLPYTLLRKIQDFLRQGEALEDNATVYLSLSDGAIVKQPPQISDAGILLPPPWSAYASSNAMTSLHDLGCRRYDEIEVVQIEMVDPPHCFCSSVNGVLVYEIKFTDSVPSIEMLYTIRVLHCMNGSSGFAKLIGIVTDDSRRYLKSHLVELPRASRYLITMAANTSVSWKRREKWAVQLVQGIDRMHTHGFVVGGLVRWLTPFIDDSDSAQFWTFKERFKTGHTVGGYYPPEFLYVRSMPWEMDEADSPQVTSKADIFQLGLLLWLLAEKKPQTHASPVCQRMRCDECRRKGEDMDNDCDLSHAEPTTLPRLADESAPGYFRDIVDACRRADPAARPAAREILDILRSPQENSPERHQQPDDQEQI